MSALDEQAAAGESAPARKPAVPLWLLAVLTFSGTLAMHVFVPALPSAAEDLGATTAALQMTISVYILGLAVGQLVYGPLADRFGRRPVLMAGLTIYTAASLAATLAPDAGSLIAIRLLQALGGCAGLVLARAIVRDNAVPAEAGRRLALMNLMVVVGPGIAPILGSLLATSAGWRSIFALLFALGITNLLLTWRLLPETGKVAGLGAAGVARNYLQLVRSPVFLAYCLGGGCATTSLYGFVAAAPFIFVDQLHRPTYEVGVSLAILLVGAWLGSALASHLITRLSLSRLAIGGNAVSVIAAVVLLIAALSGELSPALTVGPMFVFALGAGTASPAAMTQAIGINPQVVASASGLYGAAQMAVGALCTALVAFGSDHALSAALVLVAAGLVAQFCFWIATRRRHAAPAGGS